MSKISQNIEQKQKLNPRQILEANILQLNYFNLEKRIIEELENNPTLEADEETHVEENASDSDKEESDDIDEENFNYDNYDYIKKENVDLIDKLANLDDKSLSEDILSQLYDLNFSNNDLDIAREILGNLDERGFLSVESILIADRMNIEENKVNKIISIIQLLDPPGIASQSMQECILAQIKIYYPKNELFLNIIQNYFDDFANKRFNKLKTKLKCSEDEISKILELVTTLNPNPAINYNKTITEHIIPDIVAEKVDGKWLITLKELPIFNLKVSKHYLDLASKNNKKDVNKFVKDKINSANWFIDAVKQRSQTIIKVVNAIIKFQDLYFNIENQKLRPMILKDIAENINMDISTISRVVNGKYIQLPWEIKELKKFFSEGIKMKNGDFVSNTILKKEIINIISKENKKTPHTDEELKIILNDKGYLVARRTVTKYREVLKYPQSRLRKTLL